MLAKSRIQSILFILLAASGWASSGLFINGIASHSDLSPLNLAFLRELFTFLVFLIVVLVWDRKYFKVAKKDLIWLALMGGIGIGYFHALWNASVLINGMSIATMLQYNEAVIISLAAAYFFKEHIHWRKIVAILGSVGGTALISGLITLEAGKVSVLGLLIGLSSAVAHAGFNLFGKKLCGSYSAITIMLYAFGFGTLALLPLQFIQPLPTFVSPPAILHLAILVIYPTVLAFAFFTAALKKMPVSTANIIATSEVPMAAVLGYVFLHETLDTWQTIGAGLVVLSVVLVSFGAQQRNAEKT
jgi:drug/metabolite transporter, DME family